MARPEGRTFFEPGIVENGRPFECGAREINEMREPAVHEGNVEAKSGETPLDSSFDDCVLYPDGNRANAIRIRDQILQPCRLQRPFRARLVVLTIDQVGEGEWCTAAEPRLLL